MQEKHACARFHTYTHTHTFIHFTGNEPGAQSEKWRRCCGEYCMTFQKDGSGSSSRNSPRLWFLLPLVPAANRQNITRTHTQTGERPISFRSCPSPVCPLRRSSPLLLMIFLIRRKETEVRGCPLISSLWTSSGYGCYCTASVPTQIGTYAHTRTNPHNHSHTHITIASDRHVGLDVSSFWIGLTKSGADPLSKAWENP